MPVWEWIKTHVPGLDSFLGAVIGVTGSVALFLAGRYYVHKDRLSTEERQRWEKFQHQLKTIDARLSGHELKLSQTMTRTEIADMVWTANQELKDANRELLDHLVGRLDRTDRVRERAHDELNGKLDFLMNASIRRREDFESDTPPPRPRYEPHLVDPGTAENKGRRKSDRRSSESFPENAG